MNKPETNDVYFYTIDEIVVDNMIDEKMGYYSLSLYYLSLQFVCTSMSGSQVACVANGTTYTPSTATHVIQDVEEHTNSAGREHQRGRGCLQTVWDALVGTRWRGK